VVLFFRDGKDNVISTKREKKMGFDFWILRECHQPPFPAAVGLYRGPLRFRPESSRQPC